MNSERPVTSKARGICRYYNSPRGCFASNNCKFLHGETEKYTPHDLNKTCKFYAQGFCRHGDKCWFRHVLPSAPASEEEDYICCICFEKPRTYGLLCGCSHIFCLECIREWRDPKDKSEEVVLSGVTKQCPLCREPSKFVTPSHEFFPEGHPRKAATIDGYKATLARIPCRHFEASWPHNRFCPFGKDCFYQHQNDDGTLYVFEHGTDPASRASIRPPPWRTHNLLGHMLDNFNATLDAIRDNIGYPYDEAFVFGDPDSDAEGGDDEHRGPFHGRPLLHAMEMLVDFLSNMSSDRVAGASPPSTTAIAAPLDLPIEDAPAAVETPVQVHVFDNDAARPLSPLAGIIDMTAPDASSAAQRSAAGRSASDPLPRFSTVVPRAGQTGLEFVDSNAVDTLRHLPATVVSRNHVLTSSGPATTIAATDLPETELTVQAIDSTEESTTNDQTPTQEPSVSRSYTPLLSRVFISEPAREEARSTPPELESVTDTDPPFLTDGRGRVVWSNTSAVPGRHRDRRGRTAAAIASTAAVQQKARREVSETDVASPRAVECSAHTGRQDSRVQRSARAQAEPEGELGRGNESEDTSGVTDG